MKAYLTDLEAPDRRVNKARVVFSFLLALGMIAAARAQVPGSITPQVADPNINQGAATNVASRDFEKDAVELMARIEGWHDLTVVQIEDKISREWVWHMLGHLPPLPTEEMDCIVEEFKPKIVEGIRARIGTVIRQHFTHEEVLELIAFYKTPLGRKYAAAYQDVCAKMLEGDLQRDILRQELVESVRPRFPDAF